MMRKGDTNRQNPTRLINRMGKFTIMCSSHKQLAGNKIIVLYGPSGAGKTTVARRIVNVLFKFGLDVQLVRVFEDLYRPLLKSRGMPLTREAVNDLMRQLYADRGTDITAQLLLEVIDRGSDGSRIYVIDSRRNPKGLEKLRESFPEATAVGVTAPSTLRIERIRQRKREIDKCYNEKELRRLLVEEEDIYGVSESMNNVDFVIENCGSMDALDRQVEKLVRCLHVLAEK